jgi:hypothetical protein
MKTHHLTDEQIQAAIDAACEETAKKHTVYLNALDITPNFSSWKNEAHARRDLLKFALARLPEPTPPVVDGKTPGDIAYDAFINGSDSWEAAASAVLAAFGHPSLEAAIARMEAVPVAELEKAYWSEMGAVCTEKACNRVRARLIAAARDGQGEAVDWKAKLERWEEEARRYCENAAFWRDKFEKAEAELADANEEVGNRQAALLAASTKIDELKAQSDRWYNQAKAENEKYLKAVEEIGSLQKSSLPQLRPIAEAGTVPKGCLRFNAQLCANGKWYMGVDHNDKDTHFADIRLPSPAAIQDSQPAEAEYHMPKIPNPLQTAEVEIPWIEWHGGECPLKDDEVEEWEFKRRDGTVYLPPSAPSGYRWAHYNNCDIIAYRVLRRKAKPEPTTALAPAWQPAVGDTVRLKSGGPVMTVAMISLMPGNDVRCVYITDEAKVCIVPTACLTPAKEAQP